MFGVIKMTRQEFIDTVWSDFEFSYKGVWYYINPMDGIYYCGEAEHDSVAFQSPEYVLEDFIIDSKPLKDILPDIEW